LLGCAETVTTGISRLIDRKSTIKDNAIKRDLISLLPDSRDRGFMMKKEGRRCADMSPDLLEIQTMSEDDCKRKLARLSKGLAHPARVEILRILESNPLDKRCVCGDIVNALPLAQSSVSQHLKVLKETGWIQGEIDRPRVCYCMIEGISAYYQALMTRTLHGR